MRGARWFLVIRDDSNIMGPWAHGPESIQDRSRIDPGSILDVMSVTLQNCILYLSVNRGRRVPDTMLLGSPMNIKNVFYPLFSPVGVPCRGKNPGQNVHFIDFSVK